MDIAHFANLVRKNMKLPDFFALDIGNHSIKVAEVDRRSAQKADLVGFGSITTPFGVLKSQDDQAKLQIASKIKEVLDNSDIKAKKCVAALPESSIFTRLLTVPKVNEEKLEELIFWEARQYIPLPLSEVQTDYIPVEEIEVNGKQMMKILLVASPKVLIDRYVDIAKKAEIELIALETETIATSRAVTFKYELEKAIMILDFGANGTDMSVVKQGKMIFSQSIGTGSDALTKAIANDFNLEMAQAEKYKIAYGLNKAEADAKIYNSIQPIVQIIQEEIQRTISFFRNHLQGSVPEKLLLVGDGAKLKSLDSYLTEKLGLKAELYDSSSKLNIAKKLRDEVKPMSLIGYSVAIGLGLKVK
ncbi:type IV pilus assembly protein PilM [Candidatus Dojkabacteria bacterium]|nr:type IV pilus assembly protein PilM [Candidatus Dojkabacteria bacterium]